MIRLYKLSIFYLSIYLSIYFINFPVERYTNFFCLTFTCVVFPLFFQKFTFLICFMCIVLNTQFYEIWNYNMTFVDKCRDQEILKIIISVLERLLKNLKHNHFFRKWFSFKTFRNYLNRFCSHFLHNLQIIQVKIMFNVYYSLFYFSLEKEFINMLTILINMWIYNTNTS